MSATTSTSARCTGSSPAWRSSAAPSPTTTSTRSATKSTPTRTARSRDPVSSVKNGYSSSLAVISLCHVNAHCCHVIVSCQPVFAVISLCHINAHCCHIIVISTRICCHIIMSYQPSLM